MRIRGLLGPIALAIVIAACGSEKERSYTSPDIDDGFIPFTYPSADQPLPKSNLRIEGPLVAYVDTTTGKGIPVAFKVFDGATEVTSKARFGLRDGRNGGFEGATLTPVMGSTDPIAITTMIGVRVGQSVAFAHLVIVQQARSGNNLDATAIIPHGAATDPARAVVKVGGRLHRVDVAIVMDTTGSMGGSIDDLVKSIAASILPDLKKTIPDVAFGLVEHKDYPLDPYGDPTDFPVKLHQAITADISLVQAALGKLSADGGNDLPESQIPAMFHALTGKELRWSSGKIDARAAPAGRVGAIGFRPGALPIVVLVNDVEWHEPEGGRYPYRNTDVLDQVTLPQLADAFKAVNARFVSITEDGEEAQADELSDLTGSSVPIAAFGGACGTDKCCTGLNGTGRAPTAPGGKCRLNFIHDAGAGVSKSLTKAVAGLSVGSNFDVTANVIAAAEGVDGSKLVQSFRPLPAGDAAAKCAPMPAKDTNGDGAPDTYENVAVTTPVCFEVGFGNNAIAPARPAPQVLYARIDVTGNPGNVLLDRRTIVFVVPPAS